MEARKDTMKSRYPSILVAALALAFGWPALAADEISASKPPPPAKREQTGKRESKHSAPVTAVARPGDADYQELTGQVVYQILLAEVALQRGDVELASQAYADLAVRTRDPKILERTVEVAGHARRYDLALEAARLWVEVEPASARAVQLLTSALVASGRLDELSDHLIRLLEADKENLAANLIGLNRMLARHPDRPAVFRLVDKVCTPFLGIAEAHYAVATAASSAGEKERARAESRRALELRPDWEMAALLEAQLLARDFSAVEAVGAMQRFLERNPKAREVKLHLARALIGEKRYTEAKTHFDSLLRDHPNNPEIVYPVAILALQQNDIPLAEAQLKHLLTLDFPEKSVAHYYLGQIAEEAKRPVDALDSYAKVASGEQYLPAQLRIAHILREEGKLDEARRHLREAKTKKPQERVQLSIAEAQLLRDAKQTQEAFDLLDGLLAKQPEQPELLYETALLAERLGRMEILETYLRKLIALKPDSAQAYNALGYSLADRNQRLSEARELIEQALKLSPDDPFILDSLGWLLYRQGDLAAALTRLEKAYEQRPDPEIAAHLGEVLWMLGRKDEARNTWTEAQKKDPSSEVLADAIKKFIP
jgi:tetratricopeptide (TPR) repeat protein